MLGSDKSSVHTDSIIIISNSNNIHKAADDEVTIENYFPEVGNTPRGRRTRGIFPTEGK